MNVQDDSNISEWVFPEVDHYIDTSTEFSAILSDEEDRLQKEPPLDEIELARQELMKAHTIAQQELYKVKTEYEGKLGVVSGILEKLRDPLATIDEDMNEMVLAVIKKIVKKLILKEIEADPQTLNKTINELKSLIDTNHGLINVYLSPEDHRRMEAYAHDSQRVINLDDSLSVGDIVIKSQYAEVRAKLDERVDQLLKVHYD